MQSILPSFFFQLESSSQVSSPLSLRIPKKLGKVCCSSLCLVTNILCWDESLPSLSLDLLDFPFLVNSSPHTTVRCESRYCLPKPNVALTDLFLTSGVCVAWSSTKPDKTANMIRHRLRLTAGGWPCLCFLLDRKPCRVGFDHCFWAALMLSESQLKPSCRPALSTAMVGCTA